VTTVRTPLRDEGTAPSAGKDDVNFTGAFKRWTVTHFHVGSTSSSIYSTLLQLQLQLIMLFFFIVLEATEMRTLELIVLV
jgi:hypothetical protein